MIVLKKNSNCFMMKIKNSYIPIEDTLIKYLSEEIEIEHGVTFEHFFNIIMENYEEYSKVFNCHLGGVSLSEFLQEWQKDPDKERNNDDGMEKIVISWDDITLLKDEQLIEDGLDVEWLPSFSGMGKQDGVDVSFGLEFTPINNLKKYPLTLSNDCKVINAVTQKELFKINRVLNVYDVLSAIFYEITYCGTPEMRDASLAELKERVKDIDEQFDDDDNFIGDENKFKSMEDVMSDLRKKINDFDNEELPEEFDEYGHRKMKSDDNSNLDEILKKLNIDKPKE